MLARVCQTLPLGRPSALKQLRTFATTFRVLEQQIPQYFEGQLEPNVRQHNYYILLHASMSPSEFPSVYKTPLWQELQVRTTKWGGIVNFSWFEDGQRSESRKEGATVFSHTAGRLDIPYVSLENMNEIEQAIENHLKGPCSEVTSQEVHLYVCTHGARDCRCGDRGTQVYRALIDSVNKAREKDPGGPASRIRVGEIGHVGGHKFAANVLYFPQGEWLSLVKPEDAPAIIGKAYKDLKSGARPLGLSDPLSFPKLWRGRMGLTKEEQKQLHDTMA